jgi:hypothetical protein
MDRTCVVVGGGPSLQGFDFNSLKTHSVVAINQAIFRIPFADYFITMDYTWLIKSKVNVSGDQRRYFESRPAHKYFVLALGEDRLERIDEKHYRDSKYNLVYDLSVFDTVIRPVQYGGMGSTLSDFHYGSDSGYSAIQLAFVLGYNPIFLLGFDFRSLENTTHFHNDYVLNTTQEAYQGKLDEFLIPYPQGLEELRKQGVEVYSSSHFSKLNEHILFRAIPKG